MTSENIYYIGQTVAVGAILISLMAIWQQMRQSTKMERAAAQRDVLDRVSQWTAVLEPEEFDAFLVGLSEYDEASTQTAMATDTLLYRWAFITESALNMHRDGFFSDGTWAGIEGVMLGLLRTPGGSKWWNDAQHVLGFEVAQHLNKRLDETGKTGPSYLDMSPLYRKRLIEISNAADV